MHINSKSGASDINSQVKAPVSADSQSLIGHLELMLGWNNSSVLQSKNQGFVFDIDFEERLFQGRRVFRSHKNDWSLGMTGSCIIM